MVVFQETIELIPQERVEILKKRLAAIESVPVAFKKEPTRSPISGSLDPYTGEWGPHQAAHLLSRAMFGPTKAQIDEAVALGLEGTVDKLLEDLDMPEPPINYYFDEDPYTPVGETWIEEPFTPQVIGPRMNSLFAWTFGLILEEGMSIREKMTLFWHNHFVTTDVDIPKLYYQYITLLRENALGNFKELAKLITINPSMLIYLNGNQNHKNAPNENYARELLELFTIGKGEQVAEGDYTTYTEQDVREIARILTGWIVRYDFDSGDLPTAEFINFRHDVRNKELSHRFNNAVIENAGAEEYSNLIDLIFEQEGAGKFICRKLYRWFIYYKVDDVIESEIIDEMATLLKDNDFEIKPVLKALLMSQHFYDVNSVGCLIKNPIEFILGQIKQFETAVPDDIFQKYTLWNGIFRLAELLQMVYYFPPSVAGWKAFHQEPTYNQLWINSVTLVIRQLFTDVMSTDGFDVFGRRFQYDVLRFIESLEDAEDPNKLIQGIAEIIYPNPLSQESIDVLKSVLIPGLPDFEWTIEYQRYLNDPGNDAVRIPVELKLRQLLRAMLARPEFHLA